jgi:CheY-like chemotaxis protein
MKAAPSTNATVLYVEDDENDAFFMQTAFRKEGLHHALRRVGNGREAIDYLAGKAEYGDRERHPLPSVVLLDLNLPLTSGFEVLRWLREQPQFRNVSVVVFSSSARDEDRVKARELGAQEYLEKPKSALLFREVVKGLREKWLADRAPRERTCLFGR